MYESTAGTLEATYIYAINKKVNHKTLVKFHTSIFGVCVCVCVSDTRTLYLTFTFPVHSFEIKNYDFFFFEFAFIYMNKILLASANLHTHYTQKLQNTYVCIGLLQFLLFKIVTDV